LSRTKEDRRLDMLELLEREGRISILEGIELGVLRNVRDLRKVTW
jgi:hypothetical protein